MFAYKIKGTIKFLEADFTWGQKPRLFETQLDSENYLKICDWFLEKELGPAWRKKIERVYIENHELGFQNLNQIKPCREEK